VLASEILEAINSSLVTRYIYDGYQMFTRTRARASSNYLGHTLKYCSCYRARAGAFMAPGIYRRLDENTRFDRPHSTLRVKPRACTLHFHAARRVHSSATFWGFKVKPRIHIRTPENNSRFRRSY